MEQKPKSIRPAATQDFVQLQDLLYLCLRKWQWILLSLVVSMGCAIYYVLTTPPVYTRSADLLIKSDTNGASTSSEADIFADMGITTKANINNEITTMRSPDLMLEVAKRLHLDISYTVDGRFHEVAVYGTELPVNVTMLGVKDGNYVDFHLKLSPGGKIELSDFTCNGEEVGDVYAGQINQVIQTPVGKVCIVPTRLYAAQHGCEVNVSRRPVEVMAAHMMANLGVVQLDDMSNILTLTLNDLSTARAEDVLNTLIQVYNENWIKDKNQVAVNASRFIAERLSIIENELGTVDNDISSFKSQNLMIDVGSSATQFMSQAQRAEDELRSLNDQLYLARYMRKSITDDAQRYELLPTNSGLGGETVNAQINRYNELIMERSQLVAQSSVSNPLVKELDAQLAALRKVMVGSLDNSILAIDTQIKTLKNMGGKATQEIASSPNKAKYLLSVERQQKVKESLYIYLLQKREENELSQAFTSSNTRVIRKPSGSNAPTAPMRRNILLIAFAIGLLAPVVIIFIIENSNTVLRGRADLKGLKLAFLGEIPYFSTKKKGFFQRKKNQRHNTPQMVVEEGNRNVINEAFRVLRSNIEFTAGQDKHKNVLMVTSFNPGSGKSFITMNLAKSMAIKGKKVLVIDGDLRHASVSAYVHSPKKGITHYLAGLENDWTSLQVASDNHPNLYVMPVGSLPPNPTELLENGKLHDLVQEAKMQYDYVIIDCPPIDIVADAQIIEQVVERTLFVLRAGLLDRSMLQELETIAEEKRFKNLSVILNGTEMATGRYAYRYGYRYGYHYAYASYYGDSSRRGRVISW